MRAYAEVLPGGAVGGGVTDEAIPAVTQYTVATVPYAAYTAPDRANMGLLIVVSRVPKMTIRAGERMSASVPLTLFDMLERNCAIAWRFPICRDSRSLLSGELDTRAARCLLLLIACSICLAYVFLVWGASPLLECLALGEQARSCC